jgi:hypothetical protein
MRFQIVLAAFLSIAMQMITAKKGNFKSAKLPVQSVKMDNTAKSNANSMAINAGFCGDANASSFGSATNANLVSQNAGCAKKCKDDDNDHCDDSCEDKCD